MEELFNILSASARLDKSKRNNKKRQRQEQILPPPKDDASEDFGSDEDEKESSRDRTGKRDVSEEKLAQVHKEQIAAFRRSMAIRVGNKHDPQLPDPISTFDELQAPSWWTAHEFPNFKDTCSAVLRNIENGKWKEPTPIQMQSLPALLERRDLIGAAPTGSGKSGAFIIPALMLSSAPYNTF